MTTRTLTPQERRLVSSALSMAGVDLMKKAEDQPRCADANAATMEAHGRVLFGLSDLFMNASAIEVIS